jgi:DNA anti-recombination protein RmuC
MIDNPASAAMTSARALLQTQSSTLPKEQIRALKKLNQQLTTELETRPTANDDSSADRSTGRQSNMNMMDQSMNMTTAGAEPTSSAASAADSSKLNQRLKEMFKERITSFREAVYLLTGYKVGT